MYKPWDRMWQRKIIHKVRLKDKPKVYYLVICSGGTEKLVREESLACWWSKSCWCHKIDYIRDHDRKHKSKDTRAWR